MPFPGERDFINTIKKTGGELPKSPISENNAVTVLSFDMPLEAEDPEDSKTSGQYVIGIEEIVVKPGDGTFHAQEYVPVNQMNAICELDFSPDWEPPEEADMIRVEAMFNQRKNTLSFQTNIAVFDSDQLSIKNPKYATFLQDHLLKIMAESAKKIKINDMLPGFSLQHEFVAFDDGTDLNLVFSADIKQIEARYGGRDIKWDKVSEKAMDAIREYYPIMSEAVQEYMAEGWYRDISDLLKQGVANVDIWCLGKPLTATDWYARRVYGQSVQTKDLKSDNNPEEKVKNWINNNLSRVKMLEQNGIQIYTEGIIKSGNGEVKVNVRYIKKEMRGILSSSDRMIITSEILSDPKLILRILPFWDNLSRDWDMQIWQWVRAGYKIDPSLVPEHPYFGYISPMKPYKSRSDLLSEFSNALTKTQPKQIHTPLPITLGINLQLNKINETSLLMTDSDLIRKLFGKKWIRENVCDAAVESILRVKPTFDEWVNFWIKNELPRLEREAKI
jgi:hypothetical protein